MKSLILFFSMIAGGWVYAQTPAILQYGKIDSVTYISATIAAATYNPLIVPANLPNYHFNGYKKLVALTTDSIPEGTNNLYFTTARAAAAGGGSSSGWALLGNAGTSAGTNFLGTTDLQNLLFKSNSVIGAYLLSNGGFYIDSSYIGRGASKGYNYGSVAIGNGALSLNTTGAFNSIVGDSAALNNTTGSNNAVFGYQSMYSNTTGYQNVALGVQSLYKNTTGYTSLAIGFQSLYNNTTGYNNAGLGYQSMFSNTTGFTNLAMGYQSMYSNTTGYQNVAFGFNSQYNNTTGNNNASLGSYSLFSNTTGSSNTGFGASTLLKNTVGTNNAAFGSTTMNNNTTGGYNSAMGAQSLYSNTTGNSNTASGNQALSNNTTGNTNSAFGAYSLLNSTTGNNNSAVGFNAQNNNTTGGNNASIGSYSLFYNTTGGSNLAAGYQALFGSTTGSYNSVTGFQALVNLNTTATAGLFLVGQSYTIKSIGTTDFTAIGASANTTGIVFTATGIGTGTGTAQIATSSNNNVASGYLAGAYLSNGSTATTVINNSVILGTGIKMLADNQTNTTAIGYNLTTLGSNSVILGNSSVTTTQLQGNVGIGTSTPAAVLDLTSTTAGFLIPRLNTTQMNAIASPATGLKLYNTDSLTDCIYAAGWHKTLSSISAIPETQVTGLVNDLSNKQSTVSLTTNSNTSGQASFISNVLNIPTPSVTANGPYSPTLTNTTDISSSSITSAYYTRIGYMVHVRVSGTIVVTSVSASATLTFTLPFTANLSSETGSGVAVITVSGAAATYSAGSVNLTSNTTMALSFAGGTAGGNTFVVEADYYISNGS